MKQDKAPSQTTIPTSLFREADAENYVRDCLRIFGQSADQAGIDRGVAQLVRLSSRWARLVQKESHDG